MWQFSVALNLLRGCRASVFFFGGGAGDFGCLKVQGFSGKVWRAGFCTLLANGSPSAAPLSFRSCPSSPRRTRPTLPEVLPGVSNLLAGRLVLRTGVCCRLGLKTTGEAVAGVSLGVRKK